MSDAVSGPLSFEYDSSDVNEEEAAADTGETTPGGRRETRWEIVTKTQGLAPAEIIAQRLRSEGIPARAWQEGAGQALGLTVGLLGTGYVGVPETFLDQAQEILSTEPEFDGFDEDDAAEE